LGWLAHRARVQSDAVAAIKRAGGALLYDRQMNHDKPRWPRWLGDRALSAFPHTFGGGKDRWPRQTHRGGTDRPPTRGGGVPWLIPRGTRRFDDGRDPDQADPRSGAAGVVRAASTVAVRPVPGVAHFERTCHRAEAIAGPGDFHSPSRGHPRPRIWNPLIRSSRDGFGNDRGRIRGTWPDLSHWSGPIGTVPIRAGCRRRWHVPDAGRHRPAR
jgi:hypothetical protein